MAAARSVKIIVGKDTYYATPTGIKASSRAPVVRPEYAYARLQKGPARRLRKALRNAGFTGHASRPRSN